MGSKCCRGCLTLMGSVGAYLQFGAGSVIALTMWALNLHEKPKITKDMVRPLGNA